MPKLPPKIGTFRVEIQTRGYLYNLLVLLCLYTLVSPSVPGMEGIYATLRSLLEDVLLVEFIYLVFIRMPGESFCKPLGSFLLCLCDIFQALINYTDTWKLVTWKHLLALAP